MKKETRYYFLIEQATLRKAVRSCGFDSLLDMLRYDRAIVEHNAPVGYWLFSSPHTPTIDRWGAFNIRLSGISYGFEVLFDMQKGAGHEKIPR